MGGALTGTFGRCDLGTEPVTIGRAPTNTLVISDGQTSGRHAEVRPAGAGYVLVDVGSTNGTLLNGQRIAPQTPQPLRTGDVITIGSFSIAVEVAGGELPATIRAASPNEGAYAPTERVGAPPAGGAAYAGTAYVPPPPPPPNLPPLPPAGPGLPPPGYPEGGSQYAGGGSAPYYPDPYASPAPPPPAFAPPAPPYGQPYGGPPGVALGAPAGAPTNNRKTLLIVGGVLAVVILIVAIFGIVSYANSHSPAGVAGSYYSDIQNQKYGDAYQFLTPTLQAGFDRNARQLNLSNGQELYTRLFSCWDSEYGGVTSFTSKELSNDDTNALVRVDAVRSQAGSYADQLKLQKVDGDWKVADFTLLECK